MMRRCVLSFAVMVAVAGCANERKKVTATDRSRPEIAAVRIEQVAFGPQATYEQCAANQCLEPTPKTPVEAPATEPVTTIDELSIGFPAGGAVLTPDARKALRGKLAVARTSTQIIIRGRTDSAGPDTANARLALLRAVAVRVYLLRHGVHATSIFRIDAQGACCYIADNASSSGRARNRRVEVAFVTTTGNAGGAA